MKINKIYAVYFSATGTTKKVVRRVAESLGEALKAETEYIDFTPPRAREGKYSFSCGDLVVFGVPVYAGRIPNLLLPFVRDAFAGNGALAIPIVLFGNRNFDDALIELRDVMTENGFHPAAAAAFVGEHAFSTALGAGRPDFEDIKLAEQFALKAAQKVAGIAPNAMPPLPVEGCEPIRPYYTPRDRHGSPINILKVKPKTSSACNSCGLCADLCPMGSISREDFAVVEGKCIKCGACIKGCPQGAKYYDDEGYLYHQRELEEVYAARKECRIFI